MKDQVDELNRRGIRVGGAALDAVGASRRERACTRRAPDGCGCSMSRPSGSRRDAFSRLLGELADRALRRRRSALRLASGATTSVPTTGACARRPRRAARSDGAAGRPPIAAFTATATPEVRDDIVALLGLEAPQRARRRIRPAQHLPARRCASQDDDEKHELLPRARARAARARLRRDAQDRRSGRGDADRRRASRPPRITPGSKDDERTRVQDAFAAGSLPRGLRDQRVRDGHRSARRRRRRPLRDSRIGRGVLPGDRPRRPRRPAGDGDAALGLRRRRDARVPDRQSAPRQAGHGRQRRSMPAEIARAEGDRAQQAAAHDRRTPTRPACLRATILRTSAILPRASRAARAGTAGRTRSMHTSASVVRKILAGIARAGERYGRRRIVAMLAGDTSDLPAASARRCSTAGCC